MVSVCEDCRTEKNKVKTFDKKNIKRTLYQYK